MNGYDGADTINVSGDPTSAPDLINCGDGGGDTDTVIRDAGNKLLGNSCNGDTVTP